MEIHLKSTGIKFILKIWPLTKSTAQTGTEHTKVSNGKANIMNTTVYFLASLHIK